MLLYVMKMLNNNILKIFSKVTMTRLFEKMIKRKENDFNNRNINEKLFKNNCIYCIRIN